MWLITFLKYIITFIVIKFLIIYLYAFKKYSTFKNENISYLEPNFPFGNFKSFAIQKDCLGINLWNCYNELRKKTSTFGGLYFLLKPMIMPLDPELIKTILVKDFANFADKRGFADEKVDPLSGNLLFLKGEKWKKARSLLTPSFSSGKIKTMFPTILDTTHELESVINQHKNQPIDAKDMFSRQAMDTIGSCVFGIECNSLKDPETEFRIYGKKTFEVAKDASITRNIVRVLFRGYPKLVKLLKLPVFDPEISNFFINVVKQTIEHREKNNVLRNDFMDQMMILRNKHLTDDGDGFSFCDVAAHAAAFFAAGFESTSSTLNYCCFELCRNPDIQEKLRNEILDVLRNYDGKLTYEGIMEMSYLEKVIQEVLRKYPAIPVIQRECTKDYKMPNSDFVVKKGTNIFVSILGLHRDPVYYPDPDKFDPERFSEEEKSKRRPYTYLPFGAGPRICIGMRFALLHVKTVLSVLLKNFKFTMDPKTITPIEYNPKGEFLSPKDTIWLQAERI